jgi:hypothetical protein
LLKHYKPIAIKDVKRSSFRAPGVIFFLESGFLWCYTPDIPKTEGRWRVSAVNAGALLSEHAADLEAERSSAWVWRLGKRSQGFDREERELC